MWFPRTRGKRLKWPNVQWVSSSCTHTEPEFRLQWSTIISGRKSSLNEAIFSRTNPLLLLHKATVQTNRRASSLESESQIQATQLSCHVQTTRMPREGPAKWSVQDSVLVRGELEGAGKEDKLTSLRLIRTLCAWNEPQQKKLKKHGTWRRQTQTNVGQKRHSTLWWAQALAANGAGAANWAMAGQTTKNPSHDLTMKIADGWGLFLWAFLLAKQNGVQRQVNRVSDWCW